MTFFVGRLVNISWQFSFLVYGIALVGFCAIFCYLPKRKREVTYRSIHSDNIYTLNTSKYKMIGLSALLFIIVMLFIIYNLQITPMLIEKNIGNVSQGSNIITGISVGAFVAGNVFGKMYKLFSKFIIPISTFLAGIFILLVSISVSIHGIIILSFGLGFAFRNIMPYFNHIFTSNDIDSTRYGTTLILLAYNLGSTLAPLLIKLFSFFGAYEPSLILKLVGILFLLISLLTVTFNKKLVIENNTRV